MKSKHGLLLIALAICTLPLLSNPIVPKYISEITVDASRWLIELHNPFSDPISLDNYLLVSNTSEASFKKGLFMDENYLVVTQESLENQFHINPSADYIKLVRQDSTVLDEFPFAALRKGQSWSLWADWYYLDNSPTFGQPNDTLNAMCQILGSVTDSLGNPIEGITAYWGHATPWPEDYLHLDSNGRFALRVLASRITFTFEKENYEFLRAYVGAYPESTIAVHYTMKVKPANSVAGHRGHQLSSHSLSHNFPNPFNGNTLLTYQLAQDDFVEVSVYDITGRRVENLFRGFQFQGEHRLMWDAFSEPSGIYVFRLHTPNVTISKKCLLLK